MPRFRHFLSTTQDSADKSPISRELVAAAWRRTYPYVVFAQT
jgi:hypothetical protein